MSKISCSSSREEISLLQSSQTSASLDKSPHTFLYSVPPAEHANPSTQRVINILENWNRFDQYHRFCIASEDDTPSLFWPLALADGDNDTENLQHKARVCAQLLGSDVLEDKAKLALLQKRMKTPTLETDVIHDLAHLTTWCRQKFISQSPLPTRGGHNEEIWVLKDANSNGSAGLHFISRKNWRLVLCSVRKKGIVGGASYVIQRYVSAPLTWRDTGRKFHFRVYMLIRGDLSAHMFPMAFAHVANEPINFSLDCGAYSSAAHITNVAANSSDPDRFLGYHVVDLAGAERGEFPGVWEKACSIGRDVVDAAFPFMKYQLRASDFNLVGLDLLPDEHGGLWLLEANVPPCMGSQVDEDDTWNRIAASLHEAYLAAAVEQFVLPSLLEGFEPATDASACEMTASSAGVKKKWQMIRCQSQGFVGGETSSSETPTSHQHSAKALNDIAWLSFQVQAMNSQCASPKRGGEEERRRAVGSSFVARKRDDETDADSCDRSEFRSRRRLEERMQPSGVARETDRVPLASAIHWHDGSADFD